MTSIQLIRDKKSVTIMEIHQKIAKMKTGL